MIDVFYCRVMQHLASTREAARCYAQWLNVKGISLNGIVPESLEVSPLEFQRSRRIYSDVKSYQDVYVVADDDCLLPSDFDLDACLRILRAHPDFAILSLLPSNATISIWTPENYKTVYDADVMEVESVGGIRFCLKGILNDWPPMGKGPGYDLIHAAAIRKAGFRTGYFRNHKMLHLGEGASTVWPTHMVKA